MRALQNDLSNDRCGRIEGFPFWRGAYEKQHRSPPETVVYDEG